MLRIRFFSAVGEFTHTLGFLGFVWLDAVNERVGCGLRSGQEGVRPGGRQADSFKGHRLDGALAGDLDGAQVAGGVADFDERQADGAVGASAAAFGGIALLAAPA